MKHNIYLMATTFFVASALTGCQLDEYNPAGGTGGEEMASFENFEALQTYCYEPVYGQLYDMFDYTQLAEGGTDLFITAFDKTWAQETIYYEALSPNTGAVKKLFMQAYALINSCNSVIDNASKVVDADPESIKILVAEAKCLRAFFYGILVTQYGNITLKLNSSETGVTTAPQRNSYEEIYGQIILDLQEAAEDLPVEPYKGQYARVTKKTALGLLARTYAQGAGEGLTENGVSYWKRAQEVAEDIISRKDELKVFMYDEVEDLWAQANNRNNPEALFIAAGPTADMTSYDSPRKLSNIFAHMYPDPNKISDLYKTSNKSNYLYGKVNQNILGPSKYLIDLFDAANDVRWDYSFTTAFGDITWAQTPDWGGTYLAKNKYIVWTEELAQKYHKAESVVGDTIFPYADFKAITRTVGNQYPAKVWPKGDHSGDVSHLQDVKNVYATPYPLDADDDRFSIYLSKDYLTDEEKSVRSYHVINLDDLFEEGKYGSGYTYKSTDFDGLNSYQMFPGLAKCNYNYDGVFASDLQRKMGDVAVMRTAEVYLIAAEGAVMSGDNAKAAEYLNVVRRRACRDKSKFESTMQLSTASEQDVLDEFARELCGENQRWAILKRHKAFEKQLAKGNPRAAKSFDPAKNYLRPISEDFLSTISNADEYGNNGY